LEPYNTAWSNWTSNTTVTYQNLAPGEYTFKVKAKNSEGEEDPLPATRSFAVKHGVPPTVEIKKPGGSMYISNRWISIPISFVVGDVDIKVEATDESGVEKVDFYVDGKLKHRDYYSPYIYSIWHDFSLLPKKHVIHVVAYDTVGLTASDEVTVWRIL
ncbi:MAG TPA: hypothetical protein ENI42_06140, partial [Thermoplasmatales archaeon]|nr:hypothetical protein [Thermoplasmatales archaeon]